MCVSVSGCERHSASPVSRWCRVARGWSREQRELWFGTTLPHDYVKSARYNSVSRLWDTGLSRVVPCPAADMISVYNILWARLFHRTGYNDGNNLRDTDGKTR